MACRTVSALTAYHPLDSWNVHAATRYLASSDTTRCFTPKGSSVWARNSTLRPSRYLFSKKLMRWPESIAFAPTLHRQRRRKDVAPYTWPTTLDPRGLEGAAPACGVGVRLRCGLTAAGALGTVEGVRGEPKGRTVGSTGPLTAVDSFNRRLICAYCSWAVSRGSGMPVRRMMGATLQRRCRAREASQDHRFLEPVPFAPPPERRPRWANALRRRASLSRSARRPAVSSNFTWARRAFCRQASQSVSQPLAVSA